MIDGSKLGTMALLALLACGVFMPVSHAQVAKNLVTWNFRDTVTVGNLTAPITVTYGFEIQNGSVTTQYWNGIGYFNYTVTTYQILESQTLVDSSSNFSFNANMTIACPAPYITAFINDIGGVSVTAPCTSQFIWASTSTAQWPT